MSVATKLRPFWKKHPTAAKTVIIITCLGIAPIEYGRKLIYYTWSGIKDGHCEGKYVVRANWRTARTLLEKRNQNGTT